jgi:hypothetical protein
MGVIPDVDDAGPPGRDADVVESVCNKLVCSLYI